MIFRHFLLDVNESNAYIVGCKETGDALLVDAGAFGPEIKEFLEENRLRLTKVFITHDHYDHTSGLREAVEFHGAEVFAAGPSVEGIEARQVTQGDKVSVGRLRGTVLETHGHTPDSLSLSFPGHVFTGDALFAGSIGGTATTELRDEELAAIREHIFTLPPETEIHAGHGPSSTVAIESQFNPFFV